MKYKDGKCGNVRSEVLNVLEIEVKVASSLFNNYLN
jgi:hypothetical protein